MRPCLRHFCCVLLFSVLSLPALAAKIPVGVMRYEGETPDGSSIFHILLSPPAGITFDKLTPSFFTDGNGRSFALPSPQPAPPPLYDFLFLRTPALPVVPAIRRPSCSRHLCGPRSAIVGRRLC